MNLKPIFWIIAIVVSTLFWYRPFKNAFTRTGIWKRFAYILGGLITVLVVYAIVTIIYLYTHKPLIPFL